MTDITYSKGDLFTTFYSAARRWNKYVLPVISAQIERTDPSDENMLYHAHDMAWQSFCSQGGSRAAVRAFNSLLKESTS